MKNVASRSLHRATRSEFCSACCSASPRDALPRFDLRKQLVMDEANAILTTSLRAGVLPEAQRSQVPRTTACICSGKAGVFAGRSWRVTADGRNRTQLSRCNLRFGSRPRNPRTRVLLPRPPSLWLRLNDTIDPQRKTPSAALENRIPPTIWLMLLFIGGCLTCLMSGYGATTKILADRRRIAPHDRDCHGTDCGFWTVHAAVFFA